MDIDVQFERGNTQYISAVPQVDGQLLFNTQTGEMYLDSEDRRVQMGGSAQSVKEIFIATQGTTTKSQLDDAKATGKALFCKSKDGNYLFPCLYQKDEYIFGGVIRYSDHVNFFQMYMNKNGAWTGEVSQSTIYYKASNTNFGCVKAEQALSVDTQPVRIKEDGTLVTRPTEYPGRMIVTYIGGSTNYSSSEIKKHYKSGGSVEFQMNSRIGYLVDYDDFNVYAMDIEPSSASTKITTWQINNSKKCIENQYIIDNEAGKIKVEPQTSANVTLSPNIYYKWETMSALTIKLTPGDDAYYNEFMFEFKSGGSPTLLTMRDDIKWVGGLNIEANKTYQASVVNNIGVIVGV